MAEGHLVRTAKGPEGLGKTATELAQFLRRFGSFGARRAQCWQRLLELPEDREAYVPWPLKGSTWPSTT